MPSSGKRETAGMVKALEAQGWTVTRNPRTNAYKAVSPITGTPCFFHSTPSEWRSVQNTRKHLERHGARFGAPGHPEKFEKSERKTR